jgi:hypothetical protein
MELIKIPCSVKVGSPAMFTIGGIYIIITLKSTAFLLMRNQCVTDLRSVLQCIAVVSVLGIFVVNHEI